jgi:NHLM bacteriocin system ABC transporter ATP-binding protein
MSEGIATASGVPRHTAAIATPVPIALESQRPLPLDDATLVLRVLSGHVDLFAVEQIEGTGRGQRHHVLRAEPGALVFALPLAVTGGETGRTPLRMIAVGGQETQVLIVHRDGSADRGLIDAWVALLSGAIASEIPEQGAQAAEFGSRPMLAAGEVIRAPHRRVAWVGVERGTVSLMEAPACAVNGSPIALASGTWLTAQDDVVLTVQDSDELPMGEIWAGLDHFHALAMMCLSNRIAVAAAAGSERLRARSQLDGPRTSRLFQRLAGIIDRRPAGADLRVGTSTALAACREVGAAMGIVVAPPANMKSVSQDVAGVCLIARASQIRARRVLLRGDWWNGSVGPLVAFYRSDGRAVAILQGPRNSYVVVEPDTGVRRALTRPLASQLAPAAVMLYRSLPGRRLRGRDLLQFAAAMAGAELSRIFLAAFFIGGLSMVAPPLTQVLIDSVIPRAEINQLVMCAMAIAVVTFVAAGFRIAQGIAMLRLESLLDWMLQAAIVDRLLRMPTQFFRRYTAGDLADRALGIEAVRIMVTGRAVSGLLASVSCVFSFALMFYYDHTLAFVAAALALFRVAIVIATSLVRLFHERINFELQGWLQGAVLQFVTGVGKLRAANATTHALAVWVGRFVQQQNHFIASQRAANLLKSFEAGFPAAATLVIFAASGRASGGKVLHDLGAFLAFFAAFGLSLATVGEWATAIGELLIGVPRIDRLKPILSTATEIGEDRKVLGDLAGAIEFANVTFRYQESGPPVLDNVSMSVDKGEYLAVVGPSGSGKSTLFRLLLGFEKLESGVIFVDGRSIETIDISSFRRQIGVVLQNSRLTSGSIYDNICGGTQLPMERAWEAARLASLDEDIEAMPMGMHSWISEGVSTLSGGQRQRLMIARALVHRPRILLMDEATSALDNRTQAVVSESVSRLNVTRIVIAHRLSTVQSADRIVVLAGGRIVQTGSYAELMAQKGLFAEFAVRQLV